MKTYSINVMVKGISNMGKVADSFKRNVNKMSRSVNDFNKIASDNKVAFDRLNSSVDRLGRTMAVGLVAAFGAATIAGAQFETSVADLSAITGIQGEALNKLSGNALKMSTVYGTSASQVAGATKLIASAKSELIAIDGALETVTENALVLSKAARLDLASSANALTSSLNQFNFGAEESVRVINVLAAGSKVGASEINETKDALVKAGVAMRLSNVSFEEGNALIQVLAKNGLKAGWAGTQLKTALLKLQAQADEFNPAVVGLSTALENLAAVNLSGQEAQKIFGLEALAAGQIMIENRELVKKWTSELTGTNIATEQAQVNMATLTERSKRLGAAVQVTLIKVFNKMEPVLSAIVGGLGRFVEAINNGNPVARIFAGVLMLATTALAGLIIQYQIFRAIRFTQLVWPAVKAILAFNKALILTATKGFMAAAASAWSFTAALLANPITWVVVGIVALVAAIVLAIKHWEEWGALLFAFMGPMGMVMNMFMNVRKHWEGISKAFKDGGILAGLKAIGRVIMDSLLMPVEQIFKLLAKLPGKLGNMAQKGLDSVQAAREYWTGGEAGVGVPIGEGLLSQTTPSGSLVPQGPQSLKVDMTIDSEGRPAIKEVKATNSLDFQADIGYTNALAGAY